MDRGPHNPSGAGGVPGANASSPRKPGAERVIRTRCGTSHGASAPLHTVEIAVARARTIPDCGAVNELWEALIITPPPPSFKGTPAAPVVVNSCGI